MPKTVLFGIFSSATPLLQHTQVITQQRFGLLPFRSPLHRESLCFIFLALLRCFSSRRSLFYPMNSDKNTIVNSRLPHSEISGSQLV